MPHPANGILNAPNFANECICSFSIYTSLAMVHMPDAEKWTYSSFGKDTGRIRKVGVNFSDRATGWPQTVPCGWIVRETIDPLLRSAYPYNRPNLMDIKCIRGK